MLAALLDLTNLTNATDPFSFITNVTPCLFPPATDDDTPTDPLPPRVGRFVLSGVVLGSGATGRVYLGFDADTGQEVAIKQLKGESSREAPAEVAPHEIVSGHTNVASLLGHYFFRGRHFIVLELCRGGDLFSVAMTAAEGVSMPEDQLASLMRGMSDGLAHVHACGVVHRDMKLENLLLDDSGSVKLCDFGLAHVFRRDSNGQPLKEAIKRRSGTKSYTAPEVLATSGDGFYFAEAADVWSLGVCLFSLAFGFFPLDVAHPADWRFGAVLEAQAAGQPTVLAIFALYQQRLPPWSAELLKLLDGMLQIEVSKRWTMRQVMSSRWLQQPPPPLKTTKSGRQGTSLTSVIDMDLIGV